MSTSEYGSNANIPLFHMASCARSGETVVLRTMSAHPDVYIPMNISKTDDKPGTALVRHIRTPEFQHQKTLTRKLLEELEVGTDFSSVLVKQGVWEHKTEFYGFVLVRNPVSVYASLKNFDRQPEFSRASRFKAALGLKISNKRNEDSKGRLVRWAGDVDKEMQDLIKPLDFDEAFSVFYNRRMAPLADINLPVIHYERFVTDPETEIKRICDAIEVDFRPELLNAHTNFKPGTEGHGKNDLGKPISTDSINKYTETVDRKEFDRIKALTYQTSKLFGYDMTYGDVKAPKTSKLVRHVGWRRAAA